uniref:Uncharacterized protein n=1 Tax=Anguilla anguilla TaxID=7936 RepID=A0A0E9UQV8_ANGAN
MRVSKRKRSMLKVNGHLKTD